MGYLYNYIYILYTYIYLYTSILSTCKDWHPIVGIIIVSNGVGIIMLGNVFLLGVNIPTSLSNHNYPT
jgi:hypothetical protein